MSYPVGAPLPGGAGVRYPNEPPEPSEAERESNEYFWSVLVPNEPSEEPEPVEDNWGRPVHSEYTPMDGDYVRIWHPSGPFTDDQCLGTFRVVGFTDEVLVASRWIPGTSREDQITINFKRFPYCVKRV